MTIEEQKKISQDLMAKYNIKPIIGNGNDNNQTYSDPKEIMKYLDEQWGTQKQGEKLQESGQNYFQRVADGYKKAGERMIDATIKNGQQYQEGVNMVDPNSGIITPSGIAKATGGLLRNGLRTVGTVVGAAFEPILEAPGIKQATEAIGNKVGQDIGNISLDPNIKSFDKTNQDNPSATIGSKLKELTQKYPEATKDVEDIFNILTLGGGKIAEKPIIEGVAKIPSTIADASINTVKGVKSTAVKSAENLNNLEKKIIYGNDIKPQIEQSVKRLQEKNIIPSKLYDEYINTENLASKDVKLPTAMEKVGEDIGKSYDKVVAKRKVIGQNMSNELEKVGSKKIDTIGRTNEFLQDFKDSANTFTDSELKIMDSVYNMMPKKGTVKDVTDSITRIRNTFNELKGQNGITGTTNADRVLNKFVNGVNEDISNTFPEYGKFKSEYARLSNLLDQGEGYLGKKVGEGYIKDTSLVKSSLNSIINNGKKDFLIALSDETGDPLLDKALVSAQAMADVGNKKGESLLQGILGDGVPSKGNIISDVIKRTYNKTKDVVFGNRTKRTAEFIENVSK